MHRKIVRTKMLLDKKTNQRKKIKAMTTFKIKTTSKKAEATKEITVDSNLKAVRVFIKA